MKKYTIVGMIILALLTTMAGCGEMWIAGENEPRIDYIDAQVIPDEEGMNVQVSVSVSNFEVVDTVGDNIAEGTLGDGYYVYYLDKIPASIQEEVPQLPSSEPAQLPEDQAVATTSSTYTWENLQGMHFITVQLVDADGNPFIPPALAAVALNVPAFEATSEEEEEEEGGEEEEKADEAEAIIITLAIDDTGFDTTNITVPAGAELAIDFQNNGQIPHSFYVFFIEIEGEIPFFEGDTIEPGESITYTFTAPTEPGIYYFRDNQNPAMGSNIFLVEESS